MGLIFRNPGVKGVSPGYRPDEMTISHRLEPRLFDAGSMRFDPEFTASGNSAAANLLSSSRKRESKETMVQALRSTRVLLPGGISPATLLVEDGRITAVAGWNERPTGSALHDYDNLLILPGLIDPHVHINEPGRTEWEGFTTATKAAAAGGVTTLIDMPLNCAPETINVEALEAKRAAAQGKTWVDWATWGGAVHGNAGELLPLVDRGVPGFKCFMIHSGIDGFACVDEADLRMALERLRGTRLPLLVHAEVAGPVDAATRSLNASGADWTKYATYLASRPDAAETEAIALLIRLCEEFETPIHIVHLASAAALPMLATARKRGLPISVETCTHYLWFAAEEIPDGATEYKCAPPIRDARNRDALWTALESGEIDMVTTDHSPCVPQMKHSHNFGGDGRWDCAWGGVSTMGLALPVLWTAMHKRGIDVTKIGQWMGSAPAKLAGLAGRKGAITDGADADFAIFDPDCEWTVTSDRLHFRHKLSPYLGVRLRGRVIETWLRGEHVYGDESFAGEPAGRELVRA
jgi:allantoinase